MEILLNGGELRVVFGKTQGLSKDVGRRIWIYGLD
jgi:hypothetical protein